MEEFVRRGPVDVMAEAREIAAGLPTYVTFDIDSIDPSMAPGLRKSAASPHVRLRRCFGCSTG
jgi:arginase family enzyme